MMLVSFLLAASLPFSAGVCAHVTRDEFNDRVRTYEMARAAGFTDVRSDFDWSCCQKTKDGPFDFSRYDKVVDDAARCGITILPILGAPPGWARPVNDHLDAWRAFVRETVRHFGKRLPVIEIWNEENIEQFWKNPDPVRYAEVLKAAYEEAKVADPSVRVAFGGTSGCACDFIEKTVRAGAKDVFDIVNVHPYHHPAPPEPLLSQDLARLRKTMARVGIAERPVWITEIGWPTHRATVVDADVLRAGLALARPERKAWRTAFVCLGSAEQSDDTLARSLREVLPSGSTCDAVTAAELNARLPKGAYDLVVYPFDEKYPQEALDATVRFVRDGGTLVLFGGYPLYYSSRDGTKSGAAARQTLRIGVDAWWTQPDVPKETCAIPSAEARAVGLTCDPAGLKTTRFFTSARLKGGDRLVPLLVGRDVKGREIVGAGVYRFDSDFKGRVIVSSRGRSVPTSTEAQQARYVVDVLAAAKAQGVEKLFLYEFRAVERDPFYSEHHFGIVHRDFTPKSAYDACKSRRDAWR